MGKTAPASLETLPQIPIENILRQLAAEDLVALHVTSKGIFKRCSDFILHSKAKSDWEISEGLRKIRVGPVDGEVVSKLEEEILHGYWDCMLIQRKKQYPICYCISLDLNRKFSRQEISSLVGHYKHRMQYFIFKYRTAKWRYYPIIGIRLGYRNLEGAPSLDCKVLFDTYKPLRFPSPISGRSNCTDRKGTERLHEFKEAFEQRRRLGGLRCLL